MAKIDKIRLEKLKKVKHIDIKNQMSANELVKEMSQAGVFGGGRLAKTVEIAEKMIKDGDCKVFFGLAGPIVPGGMKNIIIDMLRSGYIDVIVTTGANLTHDLIENLGIRHYQGTPYINDGALHKKNINRIYDAWMPDKAYRVLEDFFTKIFNLFPKQRMNIRQFLWEIGKHVPSENSILKICYEKQIPIFCPAISDSGIGMMVWGNLVKGKRKQLEVDAFDDLKEILDIAWNTKRAGIWYIGGGVPKNYIQQAMQFSNKGGASYGIQITTDRPEFGGSSGAELREGISWGKMSLKGRFANVVCDATIALPIIYAALKERLKNN